MVATNVWRNAPFVAIILLAALQTIPDELYEAARIDGANAWKMFRAITSSLISPIALSVGIFPDLADRNLRSRLDHDWRGAGRRRSAGLPGLLIGIRGFELRFCAAVSMIPMAGVAIVGLLGALLLRRVESWL